MANGSNAYNAEPSPVVEAEKVSNTDFLTKEELVQFRDASEQEKRSHWYNVIAERANKEGIRPDLAYSHTLRLTSTIPLDTSFITNQQYQNAKGRAAQELTNLAVDAAGVGIGLAQAISANRQLDESRAPVFTPREQDFSQIDNLINEVRKKAGSEMPGRERAREREYDELVARAAQTATDFGVQGAGFQQAAAVQASKARREGELSDEQLSMNYSQLLGDLLGMKEGMMQSQDAQRERAFGREFDQYRDTQQALGMQKAVGLQNVYQAGSELIRDVPGVLDVFNRMSVGVDANRQARRRADEAAGFTASK